MKGLLYLLFIVPTLFNFTQSRVIVLEDILDQETGVWTEINCRHYLNSSEYFSAEGCYTSATNLNDHRWKPANESNFFAAHEGLWGPCSKKTCEIIYYGGFLPQPVNITVFGVFSGDGVVEVQARRSPSNGQFLALKNLRASDTTNTVTTEWLNFGVQQADLGATDYVFKFVVTTTGNESLALIDRIEIDLGEDVPEPPSTTTEDPLNPAPPKAVFELDVKEELTKDSEWMSVTCNYAPSQEDFWAYGCPNNISFGAGVDDEYEEEDLPLGFWTTCHAYNCDFIFSSGAGRPQIQLLSMDGLFRGDAKVTISKKSRAPRAKYEHLLSVTATDFTNSTTWTEILPNECNSDIYNISISGASNNIMVDKIFISLYDESEECTEPGQTLLTTTESSGTGETENPGTGATEPDDGDETSTKGGVQSVTSTLTTLVFVVCTSFSFYAFGQ